MDYFKPIDFAICTDNLTDVQKFLLTLKKQVSPISIERIIKIVCDFFNMPKSDFLSQTRKREIVQSRQIAMYFAKKFTKHSLEVIGNDIANKDHTTVIYSCKNVKNLMDTDKHFKSQVESIEKKIKGNCSHVINEDEAAKGNYVCGLCGCKMNVK